jgi:hypothetical protein
MRGLYVGNHARKDEPLQLGEKKIWTEKTENLDLRGRGVY